MGICFFCPNGHPLNVKAELAGKIGLCPRCHVKMKIPLQSMREIDEKEFHGQPTAEAVATEKKKRSESEKSNELRDTYRESRVSEVAEGSGELSMNELIRQVAEGSSRKANEREALSVFPSATELLNDTEAIWYVFTSDGQKYGPAQGSVLRTWINEGRIGSKTQIQRTGWNEPYNAGQLFPEIANIFEKSGELNPTNRTRVTEENVSATGRIDGLTNNDSLTMLKNRQRKAFRALYFIGFLTFVLLCAVVVLIWLLLK